MFPPARIQTLVILVFWISVVPIPALLWVGIWFGVQLVQGRPPRREGRVGASPGSRTSAALSWGFCSSSSSAGAQDHALESR